MIKTVIKKDLVLIRPLATSYQRWEDCMKKYVNAVDPRTIRGKWLKTKINGGFMFYGMAFMAENKKKISLQLVYTCIYINTFINICN